MGLRQQAAHRHRRGGGRGGWSRGCWQGRRRSCPRRCRRGRVAAAGSSAIVERSLFIIFFNVKWLSSCGTSFFAFGIYSPACVADLFGSWRSCWAICISQNDVIFKNSITSFPWHVIFRGTFWIRCWSILSKEEERAILKESSKQLEITAMEILNKFGWKFRNRIEG